MADGVSGAQVFQALNAGQFGVADKCAAQQTTSVAEAAFVENAGGTAVNVDSTFGGYTLQQVVQALQNYGLLD